MESDMWSECIQHFVNQSVKTLYADQANVALSFTVINNSQYDPLLENSCDRRADSNSNFANRTIVYSANYQPNTIFPAGDLGRIILDLYVLEYLQQQLDSDLYQLTNLFFNGQFNNLCGSFNNLTLRNILYDQLSLENKLFQQYCFIDKEKCKQCVNQLPSIIKILKNNCQQSNKNIYKQSFNNANLKYGIIKALSNDSKPSDAPSDNDFLNTILLQKKFNQMFEHSLFITQISDFENSQLDNFTRVKGGSINQQSKNVTRYDNLNTASISAAHNLYTNIVDLTDFAGQLLFGGNYIENYSQQLINDNKTIQEKIKCINNYNGAFSYDAVSQLFTQAAYSDLKRDSSLNQLGIGFREINVKGVKFQILDSKFVGHYSAMGFYFGQDLQFTFSIHVDLDDDQLLYEFLDFIRAFAVRRQINKQIKFDDQLQNLNIQNAALPEKSFLSSFMRLFMQINLKNYVFSRSHILQEQQPNNIINNFALQDNKLISSGGSYQIDDSTNLTISFFAFLCISTLFNFMLFLLQLLKRDLNKMNNLIDSCLCLSKQTRQKYSKAYKQYGFCFYQKYKLEQLRKLNQHMEDEQSDSSDGNEQLLQKLQDNQAGMKHKCQPTTSLLNIIIFSLTIIKFTIQLTTTILLFTGIFISQNNTPIVQIAFINNQSVIIALFVLNWIWFLVVLTQFGLFVTEVSVRLCDITWLWIIGNFFGLLSDIVLLSCMGAIQLLTNYNGKTGGF